MKSIECPMLNLHLNSCGRTCVFFRSMHKRCRGICSRCEPGGGVFPNFIVARGMGSSVPQDDPWAFGTRVF